MKESPKSHVRTVLQLESVRKENDDLRRALHTALQALERVQPQVRGALPVHQDVEWAIKVGRKLLPALGESAGE